MTIIAGIPANLMVAMSVVDHFNRLTAAYDGEQLCYEPQRLSAEEFALYNQSLEVLRLFVSAEHTFAPPPLVRDSVSNPEIPRSADA